LSTLAWIWRPRGACSHLRRVARLRRQLREGAALGSSCPFLPRRSSVPSQVPDACRRPLRSLASHNRQRRQRRASGGGRRVAALGSAGPSSRIPRRGADLRG